MRIVLTGGGTGGHVVPNMAVIEELKKQGGIEILYIGSKNGVEKAMIEKLGIRYESVRCGKFRRYFSFKNLVDLFRIPLGILEAKKKLKEFSPDVVFSKGGFVSVPVVVAANYLKIPIIAHESDVTPGLANKICFQYANKICVSFEETKSYISKKLEKKVVVTGNPVRSELLKGSKDAGYKFTGLDDYRPVILVMGGSQGAQQINELLRASLDELTKKFQIVHITGRGKLDIGVHKKGYVQYEHLGEELKDILAISEMVISRGGANSLFELALLKKKVLIIPLSGASSRGEQLKNAQVFGRKYGWSFVSGDITREDFVNNIEMAFMNEFNRDAEFKNGLEPVVRLILNKAR